MFDYIPQYNDNGTPRYTWLYVRIWIDTDTMKVRRLFPHLSYGNVFGAGSESDYWSCMEANSLMVHCCVEIQLTLSRENCDDYDTVIAMVTERATAYGIALRHYRNLIPNFNPHP